MNDDEARLLKEKLISLLTEKGLHWIVGQVSKQISVGKEVRKQLSVQEGFWIAEVRQRRRQKAEFLATVPYTPQEQLLLLVEAIEITIVESAKMLRRIKALLPVDSLDAKVSFTPENEFTEPHSFRFAQLDKRLADAEMLLSATSQFRQRLGSGNQ